jgi:hypothetical protein
MIGLPSRMGRLPAAGSVKSCWDVDPIDPVVMAASLVLGTNDGSSRVVRPRAAIHAARAFRLGPRAMWYRPRARAQMLGIGTDGVPERADAISAGWNMLAAARAATLS